MELSLPPIAQRIHSNVSALGVKYLHSPHLASYFVHVLRALLDPATPRPPLRPGARTLVNTVCSTPQRLDLDDSVTVAHHGSQSCRIPQIKASFSSTFKADPPLYQKKN